MVNVQIKPGKYKGHYRVYPFGKPAITGWVTGNRTLNIPAGRYEIDTGAGVGESVIRFELKANRTIKIGAPIAAATAKGLVITFSTSQVRIDPGDLRGTWTPSWVKNKKPFSGALGTLREHLVRGLVYNIDSGAALGPGNAGTASYFYFLVKPDGHPQSRNTEAALGGRELRFNTRQLYVDGSTLGKPPLSVSGYGKIPKNGRTIEVIRSLTYVLSTATKNSNIRINVS